MTFFTQFHTLIVDCSSYFLLSGFPAYLAAGLGQPAAAMYGYGGHQLEDLAALQRNTLAASLPAQLVGNNSAPGAAPGHTAGQSKGVSRLHFNTWHDLDVWLGGILGSLAFQNVQIFLKLYTFNIFVQ